MVMGDADKMMPLEPTDENVEVLINHELWIENNNGEPTMYNVLLPPVPLTLVFEISQTLPEETLTGELTT